VQFSRDAQTLLVHTHTSLLVAVALRVDRALLDLRDVCPAVPGRIAQQKGRQQHGEVA
jgi:hypothetical protein